MRRWWGRLKYFLLRAVIASLVAVVVILVPLPVWTPDWFVWFQVPIVLLLLICYLGKLLFDTLFYDRSPW